VRIDPSILTKSEQGNSFKTRIFPIFPNGERKILIGYQEELDLNDKNEFFYRMVSSYSKSIGTFILAINVVSDNKPQLIDDFTKEPYAVTKTSSGFNYNVQISNGTPSKSISIRISEANAKPEPITTQAGDQYFYGYVNPKILPSASAQSQPSKIAIIWDTSLSCKGRDTEKEFKLLSDYFNNRKMSVDVFLLGYYFWQVRSFTVDAGNWDALKTFL
jgi:hypothetical protein